MNVLDFLKIDKKLPQFLYPSGQVSGILQINDETHENEVTMGHDREVEEVPSASGIDYVKEFVEKEDEDYRQTFLSVSR